ncbi:SET and MYND domain-containing protein 4-like [Metopolophium dirhodum]|uniref:SET and MYND domain-containing protein 4-like n=1 Tax=Metopolophium dirhodum TaxID=44670 RepID=UPI00299013E4|nr:SET and MYND domain-containing protein 4-like [Metopolophium dirhodum]
MEYDNFLHYSNRLLMANVLGDVYVDLSKLKSPNSRFVFTRDLLLKHKMLDQTLDIGMEYDLPNVSTNLRQQGNELFKAKQYEKAAHTYTKCLMGTDPNTECYALALANRSAAYFHLGLYKLSLKDARWAMEFNYPSRLAYKLYERAGNAERMLGLVERAMQSYAVCLTRLDEVDMSEEKKSKFREAIEKAATECKEVFTEHKKTMKVPRADEQLVGGRNENIPALSAFVELRMSKNMGRGVYATRDINPGDVVAIDEPYICGPISDHTDVCYYSGCLKLDFALIPCPKCLLVYYCNKDCMNKANIDGHYLECPIMNFIKSTPGITRMNELAMKWFLKDYLKMGLKKYCLIVDNFSKSKIDPQTRGFDETGQYKSDNFLTAYSLDSSENKISIDVLFFFNCIAVDMLHCLILSGFKIPECYIGSVGASLVRILIILDLNCRKLNINAPTISFQGKHQLTLTIALTLYPTISLFNHSCDPNIKRSGELSDRIRVMKAIQPIPKGSQLCGTYGIIFRGHTKELRQDICNKLFYFKCHCQPCIKNWPICHYIPNRLSTLNILNSNMADIVSSECEKFVEFIKSGKSEDDYENLNYLYSFIKLLFTNVKRPFQLYEDCLEIISTIHTISSIEIYISEININ